MRIHPRQKGLAQFLKGLQKRANRNRELITLIIKLILILIEWLGPNLG